MSSIYARIEIREDHLKQLQDMGLDPEDWAEDTNEYPGRGLAWFSIQMPSGGSFLNHLEKLGYPVPLVGFRETDMLQTSYTFVCPGDGTYHEVQCDEDQNPVVSVRWVEKELALVQECLQTAEEYFQALDKFNEATK